MKIEREHSSEAKAHDYAGMFMARLNSLKKNRFALGRHPSGAEALTHNVRLNVRAEARTLQNQVQIGVFQLAAQSCPFKKDEHLTGAKARHFLAADCGTTEVVPCYKALVIAYVANEVVPFQIDRSGAHVQELVCLEIAR